MPCRIVTAASAPWSLIGNLLLVLVVVLVLGLHGCWHVNAAAAPPKELQQADQPATTEHRLPIHIVFVLQGPAQGSLLLHAKRAIESLCRTHDGAGDPLHLIAITDSSSSVERLVQDACQHRHQVIVAQPSTNTNSRDAASTHDLVPTGNQLPSCQYSSSARGCVFLTTVDSSSVQGAVSSAAQQSQRGGHASENSQDKESSLSDAATHGNTSKSYYSQDLFYLSPNYHLVFSNLDRIILIDVDISFADDVSGLYQHFDDVFPPTAIMAMAHEQQPVYRHILWKHRQEQPSTLLGEPSSKGGFPGFNSGVVLMHLDRMRQSGVYSSLNSPEAVTRLATRYHFRGHLGDQDLYTLMAFEHPELFAALPCAWNRQLCTWWRDNGYRDIFYKYWRCDPPIKLYHGNCNTPLP